MAPADPPDPIPWNRPFHASARGNQTSKLIAEPASGLAVPATRQNARSSTVKPRDSKFSGGVNGPLTSRATVIVVCGRPRSASAMAAQASPRAGACVVVASPTLHAAAAAPAAATKNAL